ncbi:Arm DNA-binding domain-containing protein [Salibacteraceae bacterium]|nr:Arm DNA-binding domain-containing protein [Salibacteraceae bacterium]
MSNGEIPIYLRITVDGKRTDFSIKRSITESNWKSKKLGRREEWRNYAI